MITANRFLDPAPGILHAAVEVGTVAADLPIAVTMRRNLIADHEFGVSVLDADGTTSLESDLIVGSTRTGIVHSDTDGDGDANVVATNVTVVGDPTADEEIRTDDATLTLDSSIVGDLGINAVGSGACVISFSRGPVQAPGDAGCGAFQSTADPQFTDVTAGDFHLEPGSPMIDAGRPAAPAAESLDIDAEPRALDGDGDGIARRDIGADEAPALPDAAAPDTSITKGPAKMVRSKRRRVKLTFRFRASEPGASFECRLDRRSFRSCESPRRLAARRGKHVFRVRATDSAGNVDPTPAKRGFRVVRKS